MQETKYCLNKEITLNTKLFRIFCFAGAAASCASGLCSLINNISGISSENTAAIISIVYNILNIAAVVPLVMCGIKATDAHSKSALKFLKIYFFCEAGLYFISTLTSVYNYWSLYLSLPKSSSSFTLNAVIICMMYMCIGAIFIFAAISLRSAKTFNVSRFFVLAYTLLEIYLNGSSFISLLKVIIEYNGTSDINDVIYTIPIRSLDIISSVFLILLLFVGIIIKPPIEQQFAALTEKYQSGSITKLDYERQREQLLKKL